MTAGRKEENSSSSGKMTDICRTLREDMTESENILWDELKNRKLGGYKFRRQHPIDRFVADFYCSNARLIIEIDGPIHIGREKREYDELREEALKSRDLRIIRFAAKEVEEDIENVKRDILKACEGAPHTPAPSPPCGEGE